MGYIATLNDSTVDFNEVKNHEAVNPLPAPAIDRPPILPSDHNDIGRHILYGKDIPITDLCNLHRLPDESMCQKIFWSMGLESRTSHNTKGGQEKVLAAFATQTDNASPSTQAEDPWTMNPSNSVATVEPAQPNTCSFQGGKLAKHLAYSHCPDPFCGPDGIAPPGHITAWCTGKTAGGA
ncbi:hypothetical protein DEU56DRAFT_753970 [Suillus clintonianus]|uniref:uncharacterized protein n=1 Tax=Suillus clintonianus TaxID=1904413 RepID=UPI001B86BDFF|nr:uncharacterized protein DEU56DRAFT_753970 [Suillus clintonianus]KAG2145916.1 hypothetical protein DEU56DRAFT_753970 [Suillus clintonianus]